MVSSNVARNSEPLFLKKLATRRLVVPREVAKDTIYIYKATKAVDKYSRKGCKEVQYSGLISSTGPRLIVVQHIFPH